MGRVQKPKKEAPLIRTCLRCTKRPGLIMAVTTTKSVQHWPSMQPSGQMAWMKGPFGQVPRTPGVTLSLCFCGCVPTEGIPRVDEQCTGSGCVDVMRLGEQTCMPGQVNADYFCVQQN